MRPWHASPAQSVVTLALCLELTAATPANPANPAQPASLAQFQTTTGTDELTHRIILAAHRLLHGTEPTFTPEFILADVASTQTVGRRRFDNFHGDLSGRYLSAIVQLPKEKHPDNFQQLISDIISHQQSDGRFGRASLAFTPEALGGEHMALLWGNGRLLVGLLDVYTTYPDDETLTAAVRLGDFFLQTIDVCSTPEAVQRLKDLKAHGYICFTQLTEGLAMLAERTGDVKYAEAARKIYPWMPPRGTQHSHGYLTTLRGVMMLYDFQRQPADLAFVEKHYADLVASPDYMPFGGVNEYFGSFEDHKHSLRDEGCSEADFLSLSLQLWRATNKPEYLERAEHCLVNELSFNQFASGDFGHHYLNNTHGYRLGDQDHKAWWCCTMHGLRYMAEAKSHRAGEGMRLTSAPLELRIVTQDGRTLSLDQVTTTTTGYLFNGPHLLGADGYASPEFLSEPVSNTIYVSTAKPAAPDDPALPGLRHKSHVLFDYSHNGFPGTWQVRLRPVGELTFHPHRTWTHTLLTFVPAP